MKSIRKWLLLLIVAASLPLGVQPVLADDCTFQLGFKALSDLIPDVVGDCVDNESHNPETGETRQHTANGTLVWIKADNSTSFTDGQRIWSYAPDGSLNVERLPASEVAPADAESRLTLEQLRNAEYRLPLIGDEETPIRFVDGQASIQLGEGATERAHAGLVDDTFALGDLDNDGIADAVVVVYINYGGTGTFIHLVAFLDRDGAPVQAGRVLLGDRARVESMTIVAGEISANMLTHGPDDGLCCPSLNVTRKFRLQAGRIASVQSLVLEAPLPGQKVASGVEVRGRTSTPPPSGSLTYLVYDARGGVIGMGRIPVTAELDQSGAFAQQIEFNSGAGGPGRIEVIDEHWAESSALATTAVQVVLEATPITDGRTSREPVPELVLEAPLSGATVGSEVELRGRISTMPFEKNLSYRIYDQTGMMVGESYISVEGDYDGPGTFVKSIPLTGIYAAGPVRIEVREESVVDGALIVSTSVTVFFTDG
ncbi:MAG: hypothetical protein OXG11_13405 [Chloroflexi bacterium]|nr:hypothetical protein [Chloroflexota bacterium]